MRRTTDLIPESVRAQLMALGIPPAKHTTHALADLFPRQFNIHAAGLNAEELGNVLVYLTAHGILSFSGSRDGTTLKKVEPGWHFCQFYRDSKQLLEMVAPYIAEGLENGEGCLWVVPTSVTTDAACEAIARS